MTFRQVREIFIFTNRERNGLLVLSFLLVASVGINFLIPRLIPEKDYDLTDWKASAEAYYAGSKLPVATEGLTRAVDFDPNRVVRSDLEKMNIPDGLARTWLSYLQKGGKFRTREELKKLYGMTDLIYERLAGHILVATPAVARNRAAGDAGGVAGRSSRAGLADSITHSPGKQKKYAETVEINRADSAMLEALPGIGPVLASRVIKYRKLLGGFYEVGQLREIYGMSDELWSKAAPFLKADTSGLTKMEINFLNRSEMGRHPYIGYRTATRVVGRRDQYGKFRSGEDLRPLFSADSLRRLLPYLRFGEGSF